MNTQTNTEGDMQTDKIQMYTTSWCGDCQVT